VLRYDDGPSRVQSARRTAGDRLLRLIASLVLLGALAACGTTTSSWFSSGGEPPSSAPRYGLVADLQPIGSAVRGKVRVIDRNDGVTLLVSASNLPPNQYRVSFNRDRNCRSPNGFGAGPPWAPPGLDPYELIPLFWNADGNAEGQAFIRGVHTTGPNGLADRSVVIYWGSKVTDAVPDVPNNRAACGLFEPAQLLQF
jgi:hypothetical protein